MALYIEATFLTLNGLSREEMGWQNVVSIKLVCTVNVKLFT